LVKVGRGGGHIGDCQRALARCDHADFTKPDVLMNDGLSGTVPETPLELGIARLRSAGKKITQARIALIGFLLKQSKPLSVVEIQGELEGKGLDELVTVYRCLLVFEELGMVRREYDFEGTSLWQYVREGNPA